jgi:hypothetical protein
MPRCFLIRFCLWKSQLLTDLRDDLLRPHIDELSMFSEAKVSLPARLTIETIAEFGLDVCKARFPDALLSRSTIPMPEGGRGDSPDGGTPKYELGAQLVLFRRP